MIATMFVLFGLNLAPLYDAIAQVESDKGKTSHNIYQITKEYYQDVCRICDLKCYPAPPAYADMVRLDYYSEAAMYLYWLHYGGRYLKNLPGRRITYEYLARVHNGGPDGWRKDCTLKYWEKVKREMERAAK